MSARDVLALHSRHLTSSVGSSPVPEGHSDSTDHVSSFTNVDGSVDVKLIKLAPTGCGLSSIVNVYGCAVRQ